MNLDNFPRSESAKEMLDAVSDIYNNSYVGKWLYEVMGASIDDVKKIVTDLSNQNFAEVATWGLRYWEERYGIVVNEKKDIEERRKEVLSRKVINTAINPAYLKKVFKDTTGIPCEIEEFCEELFFWICISNDDAIDTKVLKLINKAIERIKNIKPAHLGFGFNAKRMEEGELYAGALLHIRNSITVSSEQ